MWGFLIVFFLLDSVQRVSITLSVQCLPSMNSSNGRTRHQCDLVRLQVEVSVRFVSLMFLILFLSNLYINSVYILQTPPFRRWDCFAADLCLLTIYLLRAFKRHPRSHVAEWFEYDTKQLRSGTPMKWFRHGYPLSASTTEIKNAPAATCNVLTWSRFLLVQGKNSIFCWSVKL